MATAIVDLKREILQLQIEQASRRRLNNKDHAWDENSKKLIVQLMVEC